MGVPVADPFVIASAKIREGIVVTEESRKPNAARIPNVCDYYKLECISFAQYLEALGWKF
jgi:hypothetical protein